MKKLLAAGILAQASIAICGLLRIPMVVNSLGVSGFAGLSATLGLWFVLASLGDAQRANMRQITSSKKTRASLGFIGYLPTIIASSAISLFAVLLVAIGGGGNGLIDWPSLIFIATSGLLFPFFSAQVGIIEGSGSFSWFQNATTISQMVSLTLAYVFMPLHSPLLYSVVSVAPSFVPGIVAFARNNFKVAPSSKRVRIARANGTQFTVITLAENLAYSLDTAILLAILGASSAASFAITQRFMLLFSIVPMILAPVLAVRNSDRFDRSQVKRFQVGQLRLSLLISVALLATSPILFRFVGNGEVVFDPQLLVFGCMNGIVGTFLSPILQASVQTNILTFRAISAAAYMVISLLLTYSLASIAGASGAFAASTISLIIYSLSLSFLRRVRK